MKNCQKVMVFLLLLLFFFINFSLEFYQSCALFSNFEKFSFDLERLHLPAFVAKCRKCKF